MAQTPLSHSGYEELTCHCGAEVIYPPIPCGTRPPPCYLPCARMHTCQHPGLQTGYLFTSYLPTPYLLLSLQTYSLSTSHFIPSQDFKPIDEVRCLQGVQSFLPSDSHCHAPPFCSLYFMFHPDSLCHAPPPSSPYFMFHPPPQ